MGGWWVADAWALGPIVLVSWVFWVIVSITLHELGHGVAAIREGDRTPIETGHMTWNPIVHMGRTSLVVFAIVGIAWGAMPVNPSRFRSRHGDALVAAAGPAVNLGLAVLCLAGLIVWVGVGGGYWIDGFSVAETPFKNVQVFLRLGAVLNVVLLVLNLVPVPPLDGSRVVASFSRGYTRLFEGERGQVAIWILVIALFVFGVGVIFDTGFGLVDGIVGAISDRLGYTGGS